MRDTAVFQNKVGAIPVLHRPLELLQNAHGRLIIRSGNVLYKFQPYENNGVNTEDHVAALLEQCFVEKRGRFSVWKVPTYTAAVWDGEDVCRVFSDLGIKTTSGAYTCRVTKWRGFGLNKVLRRTHKCRYCEEDVETPFDMTIDPRHFKAVVRHLLQSLSILRELGVRHNDVTLSNLLIQPTEAEQRTGKIFESLPVICDFGLATLGKPGKVDFFCDIDVVNFFRVCRHGLQLVEKIGYDGYPNESTWMEQCINMEDVGQDETLNYFSNLSGKETMEQLYARVRR